MIALLLLAAAPAERPVVVSALTTEQLAAQCEGQAHTAATFCTGYALGVFDTLSRTGAICPSATRTSTDSVVTAVRKYLRKNKKRWDAAPSFVVADALKAAFGCKRKR